VRSVPNQLPLRESPETAVRTVGGWCEMAASLRGLEPGNRGVHCLKLLPRSAVKAVTENASLCVVVLRRV
jgi:hypothetical protein